jgi:hypothetical protein
MSAAITKTILEHIGAHGYDATLECRHLTVTNRKTGEVYRVEFDGSSDYYGAACELARLVGIDLVG